MNTTGSKLKTNSLLRDMCHLALAWCLAVAQPLFSVLGQQPQFLVAQGLVGTRLLVFTLLLTLTVPAALAFALGIFRRVWPVLYGWLLYALIVAFLALACLPFLAALNPYLAVATALSAGAALAWARAGTVTGPLFADVFSVAILIFPLAFLWLSPARDLLVGRTAATPGGIQAAPNPVFLFVLDEFPLVSILDENLEIDVLRYPGFAALAATSTWYQNATTVSDATVIAIPAALAGYFPQGDKLRLAVHSQYPVTLFTLLAASHRVFARESGTQLCPPRVCSETENETNLTLRADLWIVYQHLVLPERWKANLPSIQEGWTGFGASAHGDEPVSNAEEMHQRMDWSGRLQRFRAFLAKIPESPASSFHYYHALLPHAPWALLPDGRSYAYLEPEGVVGVRPLSDPGLMKHTWYDDPVATDLGQRRHLLQVGAVDSLISEILAAIRASGRFDESLIIITGDHGGAFQAGVSRRAVSSENFAAIAGIPLFVKYPHQQHGTVVETAARLEDLAPTVLRALRVSPPTDMDGVPLQALEPGARQSARLVNDVGQVLERDLAEYRVELGVLAARQARRYGKGGFEAVIRPDLMNPPDWLDQAVEEFDEVALDGARVSLRNPGLYADATGKGFVPLYLRGTLAGLESLPRPGRILVAANGRLVAAAEPFLSPGLTDQFATLLPPESLTDEGLDLKFYWRSENDPKRLITLQDPCPAARLLDDGDNGYLISGCKSARLALAPGTYHGQVSITQRDDGLVGLGGWSGNTLSGELPEEILVFVDGAVVAQLPVGLERPDLVARYGLAALARAGFNGVLADPSGSAAAPILRVIARGPAGAAELSYPRAGAGFWPFAAPREFPESAIPVNLRAGAQARLTSGELAPAGATGAYEIGETLDLASDHAQAHLLGDWYPASSGTRWAGSRMALAFALGSEPGKLALEMTVRPFLAGDKVPAQRLRIRVREQMLSDTLVDSVVETIEVAIPAAAVGADGLLLVEMEAPQAAVPKELGVSADLRELSFAFQEVRLLRR